jgi:phage baseplate assembly protein W|tara:strand:- start:263 stop:658 length:396 start_codon:yes stop_codon:yes gene_type:complete
MSRRKEVIYSDIRGDLSLNPATDDVLLVTNEDAIRTSIINLLNTDRYERVMQPNLGSNIRALLFENADVQTAYNLRELIYETIETFEPRCNLIDVIVEDDQDRNAYNLYITFTLINKSEPQLLEFALERVR